MEGKFYVWTPAEIIDVLGPEDGKLFNLLYDVTPKGNFEGHSILNLPRTLETVSAAAGIPLERLQEIAAEGRKKLYEAREKRVRPGRDDKVLVGWNGLMLRAFAEAASILERDDYRQTAIRNAEFVLSKLVQSPESKVPSPESTEKTLDSGPGTRDSGLGTGNSVRLYRTYKDGRAHIEALAEDYAFYADGLISLYEATFEPRWALAAKALIANLIAHFWDAESGGLYSTGDYHEELVARPKDLYDNAIPSANSVAAEALIRLYLLTAEPEYEKYALETMRPVLDALGQAPTAFGRMLCALDFYLGSPAEVALIGSLQSGELLEMLRVVWRGYVPNKVVAASEAGDEVAAKVIPLLADRPQVKGHATAYVCRNYICLAPTTTPEELARQLTGEQTNDFQGVEV